uniref:Uncharacterized protein n=1 Tax=Rhizochromulina marina TaxID=1034831 RepID=A0A7S2SGD0_9STRA|mmetsp:Transcript_29824/g.86861  ORF Transcript_29824/g.86861 Transcript_29824/m.86861 type:complete len:152 (+) Transcript_29824:184-639(+)
MAAWQTRMEGWCVVDGERHTLSCAVEEPGADDAAFAMLTFVGAGVELEVHVHEPVDALGKACAAEPATEAGRITTPPPSPAGSPNTTPSSSPSSSPRPSGAGLNPALLLRRPFIRAKSVDGSSHSLAIYIKRDEAVDYLDAGRVLPEFVLD